MNLKECRLKALKLINEYSNNASLIPSQKNADYTLRFNHFADMSQKEIAQIRKIPATYIITQNTIPNILGLLKGFEMKQHLGEDIVFEGKGCKSYYFEVDNIATIYIEKLVNGAWETLETIENTTKRKFTQHRGLVANDEKSLVRIRFSGQYVYNYRNIALYAYSFPAVEDIPDYIPYVRYELPSDFMELKSIISETEVRQYKTMQQYFFENRRTLLLNYYEVGQYIINYYRYPSDITDDTIDTYEFEVDIDAQEAIPFFIAGHVIIDENPTVATQLINEYQLKLSRLQNTETYGITTIENTFNP